MRVEPITYTDYNGNTRTERFYFNMSQGEIAKWELATPGGLEEKFTIISERQDPKEILGAFDDLLRMSYGKKSEDGRTMMKKDEYWYEFTATEAYSELILKFFQDPEYAVQFFTDVFPKVATSPAPSVTPMPTTATAVPPVE